MSRPLSVTMLKALDALEFATSTHGRPEAKPAGVIAAFASMGAQIDRTLPALERRGYAERVGDRWRPTPAGQALLADLARAADVLRLQCEEALRRPGPRSRLSPLAARLA